MELVDPKKIFLKGKVLSEDSQHLR